MNDYRNRRKAHGVSRAECQLMGNCIQSKQKYNQSNIQSNGFEDMIIIFG